MCRSKWLIGRYRRKRTEFGSKIGTFSFQFYPSEGRWARASRRSGSRARRRRCASRCARWSSRSLPGHALWPTLAQEQALAGYAPEPQPGVRRYTQPVYVSSPTVTVGGDKYKNMAEVRVQRVSAPAGARRQRATGRRRGGRWSAGAGPSGSRWRGGERLRARAAAAGAPPPSVKATARPCRAYQTRSRLTRVHAPATPPSAPAVLYGASHSGRLSGRAAAAAGGGGGGGGAAAGGGRAAGPARRHPAAGAAAAGGLVIAEGPSHTFERVNNVFE